MSFFRRVLRDERTIVCSGSGPSAADAYMPFVLNRGMVSQVRNTAGSLITLYDGVMGRPAPILLADTKYIHNSYPPSSGMPGSGICVIPIRDAMAGYTGASPTVELGPYASNFAHTGTAMTQETSRNVVMVNLLRDEPVPTELRWRAFYAITDGTDEGARRAYEFYSSTTWRAAFDSQGLPQVPGVERIAFDQSVFGGMLQNVPGWEQTMWNIQVIAGPHADVTYNGPSSLRLQAQSPTVATVERRGLAPSRAYGVRVEHQASHEVEFAGCIQSDEAGQLVVPVALGPGDDLVLTFVPYEEREMTTTS